MGQEEEHKLIYIWNSHWIAFLQFNKLYLIFIPSSFGNFYLSELHYFEMKKSNEYLLTPWLGVWYSWHSFKLLLIAES